MKKILGLVIVVLLLVGCGKEDKVIEVPLSNYTTIELDGADGQGKIAKVSLDTKRMTEDFTALKDKIKEDSFTWQLTQGKDSLLKNDETFCLTITLKSQELKTELKNYKFDPQVCSTVKGLPKAEEVLAGVEYSDVLYWAELRKEEMYKYVDQSYTYKYHCTVSALKEDGLVCNLNGNTTYPVYLKLTKELMNSTEVPLVSEKISFLANPVANAYLGNDDYYPQFDNVIFIKE